MTTESVDVPAVGNVKKEYVYGAVALVVGIGGYAWWKARGTSGGKKQQLVVNGNDVIPATDRVSPATGDSTVNVDGTSGKITTNAQWTQFVVDKIASYGFDPVVASASLGKWLTHAIGTYTATDIEVIQRAVGLAGYPPENGPWTVPAVSNTAPPPPPDQTPPPSSDIYGPDTKFDSNVFNTNGWSQTDIAGAPWYETVVRPGETWMDITKRVYPGIGDNKDSVAAFMETTNLPSTGVNAAGTGPRTGSIVKYR